MTILTAYASDTSIAAVFGAVGLASQLVWPVFRDRKLILTIQLGGSCAYAASYSAMDQETAAAVCLAGAIQTTVAMFAGDRPWLNSMGYVFLPVVLFLGVATYSGLPTVLAITASSLIMIGRMQADTLRMRGVQLSALPFGAAHDVVVGAWFGLAGAVTSFVIAFFALRQEQSRRRVASA